LLAGDAAGGVLVDLLAKRRVSLFRRSLIAQKMKIVR